ncbi:hypothetical protein [Nocardiopsis synnemataformans]|uniref:hypothetical protein n=1 Tax=Nocardiopsis synnemataformans TaxID=61305 RepID=UPI003EB6B6E8
MGFEEELIADRKKYGPPIGPYRYAGPDDPIPDFTQPLLTVEEINRWRGQPVRLTMTAGDFDVANRIFDNVLVEAVDQGLASMFVMRQLLIPCAEHGSLVLSSEYGGAHFTMELIDIGPAASPFPVRRTYKPVELYRYVGHGALLTLIRAQPGEAIEHGRVYRNVQVDMDGENSDVVRLAQAVETTRNAYGTLRAVRVRELGPVPVEEIAFAMQITK